MSKRGRKNKPGALAQAQGFPGGKRQEKKVAKEVRPPPLRTGTLPPPFLSGISQETWIALGARLSNIQLLTEIDQLAFARYCDLFEKWLQVKKILDEDKISYKRIPKSAASDKSLSETEKIASAHSILRPEFNAYIQLSKELGRIEREFGMTPSARSSLGRIVNPDDGETDDELEEDLFG